MSPDVACFERQSAFRILLDQDTLPRARPKPRRTRQSLRQASARLQSWQAMSEKWGALMIASRHGRREAYEQLLRELDAWLRRYYGRRLPPEAAEDARQDALLAVHANRRSYKSSRPFGPWIAAIVRYKWIDQVRLASRHAAVAFDETLAMDDRGQSAVSAVVVDDLLKRLNPAQARVIRLVKLQGASIKDASGAARQSEALVKVNIHRGMKKLAALAARDGALTPDAGSSKPVATGRE